MKCLKNIKFTYLIFVAVLLIEPHVSLAAKNSAQITDVEVPVLKEWQRQGGFQINLKYDQWTNDVPLLQKVLGQNPALYTGKPSYHYDLETKEAVQRFQRVYRISPTGEFDTKTRRKLNDILFEKLCPQSDKSDGLTQYMVTKEKEIDKDYVPQDLIDITEKIRTAGVVCVAKDVVTPLESLFRAAEKDKVKLMVTSGYRKPEVQKFLYDSLQGNGTRPIDNEVAKPGHSEHQLGTTVDLTDASINYAGVSDQFAKSEGGKWLLKNAHKYGFTLSYPKDKEKVTGYIYEPWHWRYVGKGIAATLHKKKITFAEYNQKPSKQKLVSKNNKGDRE